MIANIESLKAHADIVAIIEHFIPIRKSGTSFSAPCPFHKEKTPSFMVSREKQIFKCFSCDKGGDFLAFIQDFTHCDFQEACEVAAKITGFTLEYTEGTRTPPYEALEKISRALTEALEKQTDVRDYLTRRGLTSQDFLDYSIGYVPNAQELLQAGISEAELLHAGLALRRAQGLSIPSHGRISFTLRNSAGKAVGLACRTQPYKNFKNAPKYINSKESLHYKKSEILYLLHQARESIKEQNNVYITEGYIDAIAMHKLGYKNTVATGGTALTLTHIAQLKKIAPDLKLTLLLDYDKAGAQATKRALDLLYSQGFYNIEVARILNQIKGKSAKDTGEVLESGETLQLKNISGFEYVIKYLFRQAKTPQEKDKALQNIRTFSTQLDYYKKASFLTLAQEILQIPRESLETTTPTPPPRIYTTPNTLQAQVLKAIMLDSNTLYRAREFFHGGEFYELETSYLLYKTTQKLDDQAQKIILDESLRPLASPAAFIALKRNFYERELEKARAQKFINKILYLQERIKELEKPNP